MGKDHQGFPAELQEFIFHTVNLRNSGQIFIHPCHDLDPRSFGILRVIGRKNVQGIHIIYAS